MKTHWLFGKGPNKIVEFKHEIDQESDCRYCLHRKVCDRHNTEQRCINYEFGTSEHRGCGGCLHRFTRWDKDAIPCFHCEDFLLDESVELNDDEE